MIRTVTCHVVVCDICPERLQFDYIVGHFTSTAEAIKAALGADWTDLGGGRLACNRSDAEHDDARDAARVPAATGGTR